MLAFDTSTKPTKSSNKKCPTSGKKCAALSVTAVVVDRHILTQLVQVETEDRRRVIIGIEDITTQSPIKNTDQPADDRDDTPPAAG